MTIFFRNSFFYSLLSLLFLKSFSIFLKILASIIILTSGFGNQALFQSWQAIFNFSSYSGIWFFFELLFSILCLIVSYFWLQQLKHAKKTHFKKFPGNLALFVIFILLLTFSSHWTISILFVSLYFLAKKTKQQRSFNKNSLNYN